MRDGVGRAGRARREDVYASPRRAGSPSSSATPRCCRGRPPTGPSSASWAGSRSTPRSRATVDVVVRPESIVIHAVDGSGDAAAVPARVVGRSFYGHDQLVELELDSGRRVRSRGRGTVVWDDGPAGAPAGRRPRQPPDAHGDLMPGPPGTERRPAASARAPPSPSRPRRHRPLRRQAHRHQHRAHRTRHGVGIAVARGRTHRRRVRRRRTHRHRVL